MRALDRLWELEGEPATPMLRGHNVSADFDLAIRYCSSLGTVICMRVCMHV
jgi:hypothetical protein